MCIPDRKQENHVRICPTHVPAKALTEQLSAAFMSISLTSTVSRSHFQLEGRFDEQILSSLISVTEEGEGRGEVEFGVE